MHRAAGASGRIRPFRKHLVDGKQAEGDERLLPIVYKSGSSCNRNSPVAQELGHLAGEVVGRSGIVDRGICSVGFFR
jgi:hypothetical protein